MEHRTPHRTLLSLAAAAVVAGAATLLVVQVDASEPLDRPVTTLPPTSRAPSTTTTLPTTTLAPTTTAPSTTTPVVAAQSGDEAAVVALQERLVGLRYWLGAPDGTMGRATKQAVLAFQKAEGLERDGNPGPATMERLAVATTPQPSALIDGVEIDLARQLLFVITGGAVEWVINTSTGTSRTPTPRGDFVVNREIDGMRHAPLGNLYRPKYFKGGIAVHGSASIPGYPASHGCARVSNAAMDFLWSSGLVEIGTPVRVV